jgi:hypothetical protein
MLVRKAESEVIDHLGFVEGVERLVIAARGMIGWEEWESGDGGFPPLTFFPLFPSFFMAALTASNSRQIVVSPGFCRNPEDRG